MVEKKQVKETPFGGGSASGGVGQIPPDTTGYDQRADPTGMHSCIPENF